MYVDWENEEKKTIELLKTEQIKIFLLFIYLFAPPVNYSKKPGLFKKQNTVFKIEPSVEIEPAVMPF